VGIYAQYFSNRFVWYAKHNCLGSLTYSCFLNYAIATHQSIKTSIVSTYLDNPDASEHFIFNEITNWSQTYHDAAGRILGGFWGRVYENRDYNPDVNISDRSKRPNE
jgi:hypothetical protein